MWDRWKKPTIHDFPFRRYGDENTRRWRGTLLRCEGGCGWSGTATGFSLIVLLWDERYGEEYDEVR